MAELKGYGENLFKGSVASRYLEKQNIHISVLDTNWANDSVLSDKVRILKY